MGGGEGKGCKGGGEAKRGRHSWWRDSMHRQQRERAHGPGRGQGRGGGGGQGGEGHMAEDA